MKLAGITWKLHYSDLAEHSKTGKWRAAKLPEDLVDDAQQATVSVMLFTSRVRDDGIRQLAEKFVEAAASAPRCLTKEEAEAALNKMSGSLLLVHKRTGEALRKLDDDQDANIRLKRSARG